MFKNIISSYDSLRKDLFYNMRLFLWKLLHITFSLSGQLHTFVQAVPCTNVQLRDWNPASTLTSQAQCPGSAQKKHSYMGFLQPWNFLPSIDLGDSLTHSYSPTVSFLTLGMPSLYSCHSIIAFLISPCSHKIYQIPQRRGFVFVFVFFPTDYILCWLFPDTI